MIVLDNSNFYAMIMTITPKSFDAIAHEFLTAYNALTGIFTAAQPLFSDIAGIASPAQLPIATDSTVGAIKPDGVTVSDSTDGTVYTMVSVGSGAPSGSPATLGNPFYFDSAVSPWNGYVWHGNVWNRFS